MTYAGWCQVAFSAEVGDELVPAQIGSSALVLVRQDGRVRAYDAVCPHRGAHLAYGGRLDGDAVICPFHGHRIRLGLHGERPFCVRAHRTLDIGGAVYVLLDETLENGFGAFMERLEDTHYLVPGFALDAAVAAEYVIENVFDADHFVTVHGVNARPDLHWEAGESGELVVDGVLRTDPGVEWHGPAGPDDDVHLRFCAHVFGPTLVATELGPAGQANVVLTAATPTSPGHCAIRLLVAIPRGGTNGVPTVDAIGSLLAGSRLAFEQDMAIWEHMDTSAPSHFVRGDALVLAYRDFCARFEPAAV
jgi:3-ketosteroid 9alpha-monooxygenase subunit A